METLDFGGLDVSFDARVLRPRPWTLAQSLWAADLMQSSPQGPVLELCCGAGHIGLAAVTGNERSLVCVDRNPAAVEHCRANAAAAGLAERTEIRLGDLATAIRDDEVFAVVIADPPWVPASETGRFPEDPLSAIDGGDDGLDVARACLEVVERHLAPGGSCVLQLGSEEQADGLDFWARRRGELVLVELRTFGARGTLARFDRGTWTASAGPVRESMSW